MNAKRVKAGFGYCQFLIVAIFVFIRLVIET